MAYLTLAVGLGTLFVAAEFLVRSASRLAASLGVPKIVVGLTIVAFGTSAPELVTSTTAAWSNQSGIALGNVVGSNLANILLILGLAAVVSPLRVAVRVVRWDVPVMVGVSLIAFLLARDGSLGVVDGLALIGGLALFTYLNFRNQVEPDSRESTLIESRWSSVFVALASLVGLAIGSRWFVDGSVAIARAWELNEFVIGLSVVAIGTSMPEAVTSLVAAWRGERDIAVANVLGSNVFNLLGVLGVAALVAPGGIDVPPTAIRFDLPLMCLAAVVCLPIFFTGFSIQRWEGALLLGYYAVYLGFIIRSTRSPSLAPFYTRQALYFAGTLTLVMLVGVGVETWRELRSRSGST